MNGLRLLTVDDDRFITTYLETVLSRAGYAVTVAADGQAALDLLARDNRFDTVLLDRQMPGMDGMEVLRQMKASDRLKDIPVVLETGMDSIEDIREGLRAGALHYLLKPLDPQLVVQVVGAATREYAARRRMWAALEATRTALGLIRGGTFTFQTIQECHNLAALLARTCPDPRRAVTGLTELMINALEHGNLGISYEEKSALIERSQWDAEMDRRAGLPENAKKWVTVSIRRSEALTRFRIQDMGEGFMWTDFQEINPGRMFDSHGRGILMAKFEAFDRVEYRGSGNLVVADILGG